MSWYNQDNQDFIDGTQQFQTSSGGTLTNDNGTEVALTDVIIEY